MNNSYDAAYAVLVFMFVVLLVHKICLKDEKLKENSRRLTMDAKFAVKKQFIAALKTVSLVKNALFLIPKKINVLLNIITLDVAE